MLCIIFISLLFNSLINVLLSMNTGNILPSENQIILSYLQQESYTINNIQQNVITKLKNKSMIPIGEVPLSLHVKKQQQNTLKIATSTKSNTLECRVSLTKVPLGKKCIAPCQCTGSQQWIQFSEFNKLRRRDPNQWKICRTCQAPYNVDSLVSYQPSLQSSIITLLLDKIWILRSIFLISTIGISFLINLPKRTIQLLTSTFFWNQYINWSKVSNLPLVLKLWGGRILIEYMQKFYLRFENEIIISKLADMETSLLEPSLPLET